MALIQCHECKNNVSTEADSCPHCGAKVKVQVKIESKGTSSSQGIAIIVICLVVLGALMFGTGSGKSNTGKMPIEEKKAALEQVGVPFEDISRIPDALAKKPASIPLMVSAIQIVGNKCDSISSIKTDYDEGLKVECNEGRYEYQFKDVGGKMQYKVIR